MSIFFRSLKVSGWEEDYFCFGGACGNLNLPRVMIVGTIIATPINNVGRYA